VRCVLERYEERGLESPHEPRKADAQ